MVNFKKLYDIRYHIMKENKFWLMGLVYNHVYKYEALVFVVIGTLLNNQQCFP